MKYPTLNKTPIKEIIFSISFEKISNENIVEKFKNSKLINSKFNKIEPLLSINIDQNGTRIDKNPKGYRFINEGEIIQIKEDSYSYHYLNKYEHFDIISETFIRHLEILNKEDIELKSLTIRYINVLDIEDEIPESRLVQLYPKYSSDRKIKKFQNSVNFNYNKNQDIDVNVVTTKPNDNYIILDISARKNIKENEYKNQIINEVLVELREVKNKAFYDSITAKALLKYI